MFGFKSLSFDNVMKGFTKTVDELEELCVACDFEVEDLRKRKRDIEARINVEEHERTRAFEVVSKLKELIGA